MRRITLALCFATLLTSSAFAQQAPTPAAQAATAPPTMQTPVPPRSGQQPASTAPGTLPPPGQQAPRGVGPSPNEPSTWYNVRVDITISDAPTATTQSRKTVSLLTADGRSGQIRSSSGSGALINVDARPQVHRDGRILLQLTVEYQPDAAPERGTGLTESLHVFLSEGKPTVVSQSSDPRSERKVSLEVTATIVR